MKIFSRCTLTVTLALAIVLTGLKLSSFAELLGKQRNILRFNSYNQEMNWVEDIVQSVKDELEPVKNNLCLHIENMDTKFFFRVNISKFFTITFK